MNRILFDVREFGAKGDGAFLCTEAIQSAIDAAFQGGGGQIYFPPGQYLTGTIYLKTNCVLFLESGSEILGTTDYSLYGHPERKPYWVSGSGNPMWKQYWSLIVAIKAERCGICGNGSIDGRGDYRKYFPNPADEEQRRPFLITFDNCKDSFMRDVTLRNSAAYAFLGFNVKRMNFDNVKIFSRESVNGDGLDFDGGSDVIISNCYIDAGDDAISLKTTDNNEPCERFVVSNCILKSRWAAVRLGTESAADMRDFGMNNCVFENCRDGFKIQSCGGAVFENMHLSNIVMRNVKRPLLMTLNQFRISGKEGSIRPAPGKIRNISFRGIEIDMPENGAGFDQTAMILSGTPQARLEQISFSDVKIAFRGGGTARQAQRVDVPELYDYAQLYPEVVHFNGELPCSGIFIRHAEGVRFDGCELSVKGKDERPIVFGAESKLYFSATRFVGDCPEAVVSANCDVTQHFCSFNDGAFSCELLEGERKKIYDEFQSVSRKFYESFQKIVEAVDRAEKCKCRERLDSEGMISLPNRKYAAAYLYIPRVYGSVALLFENREVCLFEVPEQYNNYNTVAFDVGAFGGKRVEVVSADRHMRGLCGNESKKFSSKIDSELYFCYDILE